MENPRTPAEQAYLVGQVYNDIDSLVQGVRARVEAMRMEVLASGQVTVKENGLNFTLDYHVPTEHKEALTGTNVWTNENSDPLADIERWIDALDTKPTRALTSRKIYRALATHPKIIAAIFGKDSGRVVSQADLDAFMETHSYPVIRTYDENIKYSKLTERIQQRNISLKTNSQCSMMICWVKRYMVLLQKKLV